MSLISRLVLSFLILIWPSLLFSQDNFIVDDYVYVTDHPKAKGVNFKLRIPQGWRVREGNRPHIVTMLEYGHGENYVTLGVLMEDNVTFYTRAQAQELFDTGIIEESIIEMLKNSFKDVKFRDAQNEFLNSYPARFAQYVSSNFASADFRKIKTYNF